MSDKDEILEEGLIETKDQSIAAVKWLLRSPDCPPLPETVLDVLLTPGDLSEEEVAKMQKEVIAGIFADLHRKPVRQFNAPNWFARYLKEVTEVARLHPENVAEYTGQPLSLINKIFAGEVLPWQLDAKTLGADLVFLFRIHINGARQLVLGSIAVSQGRAEIDEAIRKADRRQRPQLRTEADEQAKAGTDEFYARFANESLMTEEANKWLNDVLEELKRRKAIAFIKQ